MLKINYKLIWQTLKHFHSDTHRWKQKHATQTLVITKCGSRISSSSSPTERKSVYCLIGDDVITPWVCGGCPGGSSVWYAFYHPVCAILRVPPCSKPRHKQNDWTYVAMFYIHHPVCSINFYIYLPISTHIKHGGTHIEWLMPNMVEQMIPHIFHHVLYLPSQTCSIFFCIYHHWCIVSCSMCSTIFYID